MDQILDENEQHMQDLDENTKQVGLYKVIFEINDQQRTIDLLLTTKKKKKKDIRSLIAIKTKRKLKEIKKVKLRFRKHIQGYTSGLDGTKAYFQLKELQKQERKRKGQEKRIFSRYHIKKHPFKPQSRTVKWTRHLFVRVDDLRRNILNNHHHQTQRYWFDIQFGYILRNVEIDERIQFYPSGNTSFFNVNEHPLVNTSVDNILEQLGGDDVLERLKRPNSRWSIERIYEYVLLTTPLEEIPIGSCLKLPDFIINSRSIVSFEIVPNNMCFWFSLAHHKHPELRLDRLSTKAKDLYKDYYKAKAHKNYSGVDIQELNDIEDYFRVNINVYRFNGKKALMERHSKKNYESTISLNIYTDLDQNLHHFSYIINLDQLTKVYQCPECHSFFSEFKKIKRHLAICTKPKIIFEEGNYQPKLNVFENLEWNGINVPKEMRFYPYFIYFDFETWLKPVESKTNSKQKYLGTHELLSISFIGSEENNAEFIPVEGTTEEALDKMMTKMNEIRKKYLQLLYPKYSRFFGMISNLEDEKVKKRLRSQLLDWLDVLPVYGFNSSSYDINVIKKYLPQVLMKHNKKHGNVSKSEKLWIRSIEEELGRNIEQNKRIGRYNADGYDEETNTAYEFNGCFFHGCNKCYKPDDINPLTGDKMNFLHEKTMRKEANLKQMGYKIKSIWGCEFQAPKNVQVNDIIKCNNKYRMISNGSFAFKDILAFQPPNTSFDKFLKAFDTQSQKGIFSHKVTQNLSKFLGEHPDLKQYSDNVIQVLKHSHIPSKKWFHNDLKGESISTKDYNEIASKYTNLYDLLKDYNNLDVKPGVEATKKLGSFFRSLNLDMHKDGISIPGLTLKYLWNTKDKDCEFQLFKGNEDLYQKYRDNLVGGPSIVFHHYHEKDKTRIRKGKLCQRILGYDANALYLWALSQDMPCGDHQIIPVYPEILKDVLKGSFFGQIECDIAVPDHLKEYFAEMPPIFKNTEIQYKDLSSETKEQVKPNYKSKKLVGSMFGKKMLFPTELLKWYLEHGLVVSNITFVVRYERKAPFKSFAEQVSNERRAGDASSDYKLRGEMMKLMGNASYGKCITNFLIHETVKIVSQTNYNKNVRRVKDYIDHQDLNEGYECRFKKTSFKQSSPIHIGFQVYQLAKLRMLEFYYDFMDYYIDRSDFQYCMMDTDSAYFAISGNCLEDLIKPSLKVEFKQNKQFWLGREDTQEHKLYDSRTPGLFKLEHEGDCIISLASKMYYCDAKKFSSKGINKKQNEITKQTYLDALNGNSAQEFVNNGFRVNNNQMNTYCLTKTGMKLFNDKRLRVGFETFPTGFMDRLHELYYNPKTGFTSARKLYLKLNKEVPMSQIKEFLERQQVNQLHKDSRQIPAFNPIVVYSVNDQWQIDLIDLSKYSRWNTGFKYLLCGIDVFSRKSFVVAMKRKSDTTNAMKLILDVQKPILIQSDNGTEFLNHSFQNLLQAKGVRHITVNVGDHNRQGLIERFNRTLEGIIAFYQESRKSNRYIDVLEDIVFNYNHTYHRGVDDIPELRYQKNPPCGSMKVKAIKHSINVGDHVRILKEKQTFQKGYEPKYSSAIYTVVSGNGYSYSIADDEGEILQKKYKYYELQRIAYSETFVNEPSQREPTMTNKERRNKREIDDLLEHTVEPLRKKRRMFTGTYFLE